MKDERKYREVQEEKEDAKERQARNSDEDAAERQKSEAKRHSAIERYDGVSGTLLNILSANPHFTRDERLTPPELLALEVVHKVKVGQNEEGTPANARTRRLLLNQALAALQPVLSLALAPRLKESLLNSYKQVQKGVTDLRSELKTAQLMEMHSGKSTLKAAAAKKLGADDAAVAESANLAADLIQLWKKRKKRRFRHNLNENPVGHALAAIADKATAIAEAAAVTARLGEKIGKQRKPEKQQALLAEWEQAGAALVEAVREFLAMCDPESGAEADVGTYPHSLLPRFAELVDDYANLTSLREALEAGSAILENAIWCESNQDEVVAAEAKK